MPQPAHNLFNTHRTLEGEGFACTYYSLPALEGAGIGSTTTLPVSLRILLESLLRNYDGHQITEEDIVNLANWEARSPKSLGDSFQTGTRGSTRLHRRSPRCRYRCDAFRCGSAWR